MATSVRRRTAEAERKTEVLPLDEELSGIRNEFVMPRSTKETTVRAGYAPFGIVGTIILIVLILWLLGVF